MCVSTGPSDSQPWRRGAHRPPSQDLVNLNPGGTHRGRAPAGAGASAPLSRSVQCLLARADHRRHVLSSPAPGAKPTPAGAVSNLPRKPATWAGCRLQCRKGGAQPRGEWSQTQGCGSPGPGPLPPHVLTGVFFTVSPLNPRVQAARA